MNAGVFFFGFVLSLVVNILTQLNFRDKYLLSLSLSYWHLFPIVALFSYFLINRYKRRLEREGLYIVLISTLLIFILFRAGLFSPGPINIQDYPIHYFASYNMANSLFPNFQSTVGPTSHFQLGCTLHFDYPVLAPALSALLFYVLQSIPFWVSFRFVVGLSFCLPVFAVYLLSKRVGLNKETAFLASILSLSWTNIHFIGGMYSSYLSLGLGMLSIYILIGFLKSRENHLLILSATLAALSFLSHSLVSIPFLITYLIFLVMNRDRLSIRKVLLIFLVVSAISVIYPAALLNKIDYVTYIFSRLPEIFGHLYNIETIFWNSFYLDSSLIVLLSLPLLMLDYKNRYIDIILYTVLFLLFLTFVINFIQTDTTNGNLLDVLLNAVEIDRVVFFTRPLWAILCAYSICWVFRVENRLSRVVKSVTVASVFIFVVPYIVYMTNSWHNSDDPSFLNLHNMTMTDYFSLRYDDGVLSFRPNSDVMETYSFLKYNTDNSVRILWEESTSGKLGGNIKAMASYFTDRLFVGGVYMGVILEGNEGAYDGIFFQKRIDEYETSELQEILDQFNVGIIAVWTNVSKNYFQGRTGFERVYTSPSGLISIYNYTGSKRSFVIYGNADVVNIEDSKITIDVWNESELLLSFRYEPDWHAYSDGREILIEREGILMSIGAPAGRLEIVYLENPMTRTAKYVSIFSFSISLLCAVYLFKRSRTVS